MGKPAASALVQLRPRPSGGMGLSRSKGGAGIAAALLAAGLVDGVAWFHAPTTMGGDGLAVNEVSHARWSGYAFNGRAGDIARRGFVFLTPGSPGRYSQNPDVPQHHNPRRSSR